MIHYDHMHTNIYINVTITQLLDKDTINSKDMHTQSKTCE